MRNETINSNAFQTFSTLLALLLPILQFFFNFLPAKSKSIFLMSDYFLVISIIAGVFAYILIIAFKNTIWFSFAPNWLKAKKYRKYQKMVNPAIYNEDEVRENTKTFATDTPFYVRPDNVYYVLIPFLFVFAAAFFALGLFFGGDVNNKLAIFAQAILYILIVGFTTLTLGAFYINELNYRKREARDQEKYRRVVQLLFENRALGEFPTIDFIGQGSPRFDQSVTIVKVNNRKTYQIVTDLDVNVLRTVEEVTPQVAE